METTVYFNLNSTDQQPQSKQHFSIYDFENNDSYLCCKMEKAY